MPATLTASPSEVNRETLLCVAADNFIETWRAWTAGPDQLLTADFEESIENMLEAFRAGEIPASCREMADAVRALDAEWSLYQENITTANQMPQGTFWGCVEGLYKAAAAVEDPPPPMRLEPIPELIRQNVKPAQIAIQYAARDSRGKWVGPFCRNGEPCVALVFQEMENPGSVIPANWIHPQEIERQKTAQDILNRRSMWDSRRKARGLPPVEREAPESIEELLQQGVNVRQIVKIKRCTEAEVVDVAGRIGVTLQQEPNEMPRAPEKKKRGAGKIPPKPDTVPESPGLADEVKAASRLNPGWSHSELATEFGVAPERIGEILAGGAGADDGEE